MFRYFVLWVQVLSEMLPISSSTQVELLQQWYAKLHGSVPIVIPQGFDYFLHIPLLIVVPLFFMRGWWGPVTMLFNRLWRRERLQAWSTKKLLIIVGKLIGLIFICGVLAEGVSVVLKSSGDLEWLRPVGLAITAMLLVFVSLRRSRVLFSPWSLLWVVGIAQALAFLPGISRMGITVTVALLCGLSTRRALEFSFALQYPLVIAAVLLRCVPWLCSADAAAWIQPWLIAHLVVAGVVSYGLLWLAAFLFATRRAWLFGAYVALCAVWVLVR